MEGRLLGVALHSKSRTALLDRIGATAVLALLCTGCPVGAELDTDPAQYVVVNASTTTGATTGGGCATIDDTLTMNCSGDICHGEAGMTEPPDSGLNLFTPDRDTALLDRAGMHCPNEKIIDTADPARSLLITTLAKTADCGVEMPGFPIMNSHVQCIESWVTALATGN